MPALVLRRLPSGPWALLAVPDAQRVERKRRGALAPREDLVETSALARLRPAVSEAA